MLEYAYILWMSKKCVIKKIQNYHKILMNVIVMIDFFQIFEF